MKINFLFNIILFSFANRTFLFQSLNYDWGFIWSHWNSWSSTCSRNCTDPFGSQYRERKCLVCYKEDCKQVENDKCAFMNTYLILESRLCYIASQCDGEGFFTGHYTEWNVHGKCEKKGSCNKGEIKYTRECRLTSKTIDLRRRNPNIPFKCSDITHNGLEKMEPCSVDCKESSEIETNSYQWSEWSEWKCNASCMNISNTAIRTRQCKNVYFNAGMNGYKNYCNTLNDGIMNIEYGSCENCIKTWSEWNEWTGCEEICDSPGRFRTRECKGFGKSCPCQIKEHGRLIICDKETDACKDANRHSRCPSIDGGWSQWSNPTPCSSTCGHGRRLRYRNCTNPKPAGQGILCEGKRLMEEYCNENVWCPVDGNWGSWSSWTCLGTCIEETEILREFRFKICNNPAPLFGGKKCVGSDYQYRNCIQVPRCPKPTDFSFLPGHLRALLSKHLKFTHNSLIVNENDRVELDADIGGIKHTFKDYFDNKYIGFKSIEFEWLHNGEIFTTTFLEINEVKRLKTIQQNTDNIIIPNANSEDSGVYLLYAKLLSLNQSVVIQVYTLAVNVKGYNHNKYPGNSIYLKPNSISLSFAYGNLYEFWIFNNKTKIRSHELAIETSSLFLQKLDPMQTGTYDCLVIELSTNRSWITNRIKVKVNNWSELFENKFVWLAIPIALLIILAIYTIVKFCKFINFSSKRGINVRNNVSLTN